MNTNEIRLIAMDMDGTLLNSGQQISPENLSALREARARGVRMAICSGRLPGDAGLFAVSAGLADCAILSLNGAYCQERPMGEAYENHTLPDRALNECVALLSAEGVAFGCFAQNRQVTFHARGREGALWDGHTRGEGAPEYLYGMDALNRVRGDGVNKLVCLGKSEEQLSCLRKRLEAVKGIAVTSSWALNLELMPEGVDKGTAVLGLAKRLGLEASSIMALGDYDNDEPMIARSGLGVAMGNATGRVRRAARHVTLTNDEDGVAAAIRRFVLT